MTTEQQPTQEEQAAAMAVGQAGAEAAAQPGTPEERKTNTKGAMRKKADEAGLKISDDDIEKMAETLVDKIISAFETRGAFDSAPEAVAAPQPAPAATPQEPGAQPAPAAAPVVPQKRSWAEKFLHG